MPASRISWEMADTCLANPRLYANLFGKGLPTNADAVFSVYPDDQEEEQSLEGIANAVRQEIAKVATTPTQIEQLMAIVWQEVVDGLLALKSQYESLEEAIAWSIRLTKGSLHGRQLA